MNTTVKLKVKTRDTAPSDLRCGDYFRRKVELDVYLLGGAAGTYNLLDVSTGIPYAENKGGTLLSAFGGQLKDFEKVTSVNITANI